MVVGKGMLVLTLPYMLNDIGEERRLFKLYIPMPGACASLQGTFQGRQAVSDVLVISWVCTSVDRILVCKSTDQCRSDIVENRCGTAEQNADITTPLPPCRLWAASVLRPLKCH